MRTSAPKDGRPPRLERSGWKVFWHSFISVRRDGWLPRLVIHEKFERHVKWTLRTLWLVGIFSAVVSMGPVVGVIFALALSAVEQFIERAVMQYTTIIITPVPTFSITMDEITGMAYMWLQHDKPNHPDITGFCFARDDVARQFFDLIRAWNYGEEEDKDDNVKLTIVWPRRGDGYYVCMYPSLDRKPLKERFAELAELQSKEKAGKEQQELVMMWTMRKTFGGGGKHLRAFLERQRPDRPFWLYPFLSPDGTNPHILYDVKPILKWHLRVVHEADLTKKDVEYRLVVKPGAPYRRKVVGFEK